MAEERRTGKEFVIVPKRQLEIPKPPTRKVMRKGTKEAHERITSEHEDFLKEDPGEAIEIGGYHFIRPENPDHRHSKPLPYELEVDRLKGYLSDNNGVVAIRTSQGMFVGSPNRGFRRSAASVGFNYKRSQYDDTPFGDPIYQGTSDYVPHSNFNDSPWLFERINSDTGRLRPEFEHLFSRQYKKVKREVSEEVDEPIPQEKPNYTSLLVMDIKDDHQAFHALHGKIDDETSSAFAASELHKPKPAVLGYVVKKLGLSRASTPIEVRKDLKAIARRFHPDRFSGVDPKAHRRVVDLLNSARHFLKGIKSFE